MADRYENIRKALAMGPTPVTTELYGDRHFGGDYSRADLSAAQDAHIAACDPDTIRELLAERDALAEDADRYRWLRSLDGRCDAAACVIFNIGFDWIEQHGADLDAAIDQARGKGNGNG